MPPTVYEAAKTPPDFNAKLQKIKESANPNYKNEDKQLHNDLIMVRLMKEKLRRKSSSKVRTLPFSLPMNSSITYSYMKSR